MTEKNILIVDDEPQIREMLHQLLTKKGYRVNTAPGGQTALEFLKQERPDLIILDQNMPKMSGLDTLKKIRELDKEIGIVMLTGYVTDDLKKSAAQMGVDDFLTKGKDTSTGLFFQSIENVLKRQEMFVKKKFNWVSKVLVVDDEIGVRMLLSKFLTRSGFEVKTALSGQEALEILRTKAYQPDVILLDVKMPGMDGLVTLREIRRLDEEVGVIIMTGSGDESLGFQALNSGAYEYIMKPFNFEYLELAILSKLCTK
ncbi:MAG: response regulator [Planctomycetota bacterium]